MSTMRSTEIMVVDSYANGVSLGNGTEKALGSSVLRLPEVELPLELRRRYALFHKSGFEELERNLADLSHRGELSRTLVLLGLHTDPFFPFDTAFASSMRFLELFERYVPAKLIVQTRSPLIVIGLPVLQRLKHKLSIVFGIETSLDDVAKRYTPELPLASERMKAMRTLKKFGLDVSAQIAPLLPYGDWREGASTFADSLAACSTSVRLAGLVDLEKQGIRSSVSKALARERRFHWLRSDAVTPLKEALEKRGVVIASEESRFEIPDRQLSLFGS